MAQAECGARRGSDDRGDCQPLQQAQAFVEEMKRQHVQLQTQLEEFGTVIEQFQEATDLEEAVCRLKQKGEEFSRRMAAHMAAEERKVALLSVN